MKYLGKVSEVYSMTQAKRQDAIYRMVKAVQGTLENLVKIVNRTGAVQVPSITNEVSDETLLRTSAWQEGLPLKTWDEINEYFSNRERYVKAEIACSAVLHDKVVHHIFNTYLREHR